MDRKEELLDLITKTDPDNKIRAELLIDEIVFIEQQLEEVRKLPFIRVNPDNPEQQKATAAAKQYKELMQQYNNSLRLLFKLSGDLNNEPEEDSPLRAWARSKLNAYKREENLDA